MCLWLYLVLRCLKNQMVNRILCSEAMVDSNKLRTGKLEEDDWAKLAGTIGPLSDAGIYIDDYTWNFYNGNQS